MLVNILAIYITEIRICSHQSVTSLIAIIIQAISYEENVYPCVEIFRSQFSKSGSKYTQCDHSVSKLATIMTLGRGDLWWVNVESTESFPFH
jgi:hypothetical protein